MICPSCSTVNEAGRKFCLECGTRLNAGCPNCGAQNPPAAKFCGECGTTLSGAAAQPSGAAAAPRAEPATAASERRLVSVLFADLVGFTTMSQDEDPEDTREFLTRYFELARTIVDRYGGTIEKFIGDAVMAVWGTPTTHEDDAERAVRAGLELVDGVPGISDTRDAQARAGVLTGHAAVTLGASGQGMVAGDLVNTASRLQSVAPPGAVLVGEATFHAAQGAIRFEEAGEQMLKGKTAPVPAWRAAAVIGLRGGTGRSETLEPPFTGRDEELRLLKDLFHSTQREQKARLVTVIGQGGIGKSRLAWEFEKYIDGVVDTVYWHHGRSPAYGDGISYWALAEMVRGRAGIAETDDAELATKRLHETVAQWLPDDLERHWVEPRLAGLLALEQMPAGSRDELFAAWRLFFERIAQSGPAVLVFEDIQWSDEGMLDFVGDLLDRSRNLPIFVVALTRPELFDRRARWGSNLRSLTTMTLEPLERPNMVELVTGTVPGIPVDATNAIVDRAEGIPLYAVETIRMLVDRGDLRRTDEGTFATTGGLEGLAVPNSLHALIASRLDALGERERRLLQSAAVMGKSFTSESLGAVSGEPNGLPDLLSALVRRQMLQVEVDPRSPERGQYQFVQAVVREVAEAALSRSDRRALHLAAARYYESLGDDELAGVQASHYVEAYKATPAGPEADALAAQARVSLRAAAERSLALHANRQAVAFLEQAIAVTPDANEKAALHERAVAACINEGTLEEALEHARAVEAIARDQADMAGVLHAITLQAQAELSHHHERTAMALLRPALTEAAGLGPTAETVKAQAELGRSLMIGGENAEAVEWSDRAMSVPDVLDDDLVTDILITKGTALANMGRAAEGEILLLGAMQVSERNGSWWAALRARNNALGVISSADLATAAAMAEEGYVVAMRYGLLTWAYQFAHVALTNAFDRGDWDAWIAETRELDAPGFYGAWRLVEVAIRDALRGNDQEARELIASAPQLVGDASSQGVSGQAGALAMIELAAGHWPEAIAAARLGWGHIDGVDGAVSVGAAAAVGANRADWAREALLAFNAFDRRGRQPDGQRSALTALLAVLENDWPTARSEYAAAKHNLTASSSLWALALLNLGVATRGHGHMPEAADALVSAREFFAAVGAESFVDRYQTAMAEPERPARAATAAVPNAAR